MLDWKISVSGVVAYGMWVTSFGLWGASWAFEQEDLGRLSLIFSAAAATATVRTYFVAQSRRIKLALAIRAEREAEQRIHCVQ